MYEDQQKIADMTISSTNSFLDAWSMLVEAVRSGNTKYVSKLFHVSVPAGTPQKARFLALWRCADFCWPTGPRQKHFVPWRSSCCLAIH
jgi:hypothetical protein